MTDLNVIDAEFTEVTAEPFDYMALDTETAEKLRDIAEQDMRATAIFWIARAKRLTEAHELLAKNGYGCFEKWVVQEIGISRFTALRLMDAYKQYSLIVANCNNQNTAEALPQSFYRKLAANDPNAEQIKEEVLAGKIKDSKEYKAALAKIKNLENEKNKDKDSAEKTIQNLKSVLADTRKQLDKANEKAKGADPEYLAKLQKNADEAEKKAKKANLDYEELFDRFEDLNKKGGDLMRQHEEDMKMLEEIAGELKQSQELNARLLAEGKQPDTDAGIAVVLATVAKQINGENVVSCVKHILDMDNGKEIIELFKAMADIADSNHA